MTIAIALFLTIATLFALGYPLFRPGTSISETRNPDDELEEEIEKSIMIRRKKHDIAGVCRTCGVEYPKEARFCPQCGSRL